MREQVTDSQQHWRCSCGQLKAVGPLTPFRHSCDILFKQTIMRITHCTTLAIAVPFFLGAQKEAEPACVPTPEVVIALEPEESEMDLRAFDIVQRTCALEVVMRPIALRVPVALQRPTHDRPHARETQPIGSLPACA